MLLLIYIIKNKFEIAKKYLEINGKFEDHILFAKLKKNI